MNRGNMSQQIRSPQMKKTTKEHSRMIPKYARGGKVKGYAKGGRVDQMQSSPRKQAAMKGC
jgi:hypothetical protein